VQSVQGVLDAANIVVFDSRPLSYETGQIHCFCGKEDDGSLMVACDTCDVYFHSTCIGKTEAELQGDYECGYCLGKEDEHGNQVWEGALKPKPGKVRVPNPSLVTLQQRKHDMHTTQVGERRLWDPVIGMRLSKRCKTMQSN
jgi:PHD-finger